MFSRTSSQGMGFDGGRGRWGRIEGKVGGGGTPLPINRPRKGRGSVQRPPLSGHRSFSIPLHSLPTPKMYTNLCGCLSPSFDPLSLSPAPHSPHPSSSLFRLPLPSINSPNLLSLPSLVLFHLFLLGARQEMPLLLFLALSMSWGGRGQGKEEIEKKTHEKRKKISQSDVLLKDLDTHSNLKKRKLIFF